MSCVLCCVQGVSAQSTPAPQGVPEPEAPTMDFTEQPRAAPTEAASDTAPPPDPVPPPPPAAEPQPLSQPSDKPASADERFDDDQRFAILSRGGYPLTPGVTSAKYPDEVVVSGYLQAQYEGHRESENGQLQGGALLNKDRFLIRRGRIKVSRDWQWGQVVLEIDGNTVRGPTLRLQKAEVSVLYGRRADPDLPPLVQLTAGQFDQPFGFELTYTSKARWFTERSVGSRATFPSEPDVGVRLSGGLAFARYSIAMTNGEPLDERSGFGLQDPNRNKDITARFGAEAKPTKHFVIAGGVSFNHGRGYHAATDSTKSTTSWRDANENGAVDAGEVLGQPAVQGTPAQTFGRWAMGADLELLLRTRIGWSMLHAEAFAASNLDRGLLISDPIVSGADLRQYGYLIALTQEITRYGAVGVRYDYYNPDSDFLDNRAGKQLPTSQRVQTVTGVAALVLPGHARLLFEYAVTNDYLARDMRGVPADLPNNQWTLRLQGMF